MTPRKQSYHLILLCRSFNAFLSQSQFQNSDNSLLVFYQWMRQASGTKSYFVFSNVFTLFFDIYEWFNPISISECCYFFFLVSPSVTNKFALHNTHTLYLPFLLYFIHHCTYHQLTHTFFIFYFTQAQMWHLWRQRFNRFHSLLSPSCLTLFLVLNSHLQRKEWMGDLNLWRR